MLPLSWPRPPTSKAAKFAVTAAISALVVTPTYAPTGMATRLPAEFRRAVESSNQAPQDVAELGWGYRVAGRLREARQIAEELEVRSRKHFVSPEQLARTYVGLGEKTLAIQRLRQAYDERIDTLNDLNVEPCWDSLRSDPRFQELVRRMKFPR
jgi:hypothetical protein